LRRGNGGATTSTLCVRGTRESAKSRCSSRGAGATTVGASGLAVRILSRETFGAGGTIAAFKIGEVRVGARETSGAGGMTLVVSVLGVCLADEFNSGEGGTAFIVIAGSIGAMREERRPSAGGGPGFGLKASRLATAESECGRFILGSVHNSLAGLVAARYANRLSAVVGLLTAGASRLAGLRSAAVLVCAVRCRSNRSHPVGDEWKSGDLKTHKVFGEHE